MFAHAFRFEQFQSRLRHAFVPRKPRHRLLRVLMGVIGLALLVVLVMFGLFVGASMITAGLLYRLWKQRGKPALNKHGARNSRSQVLNGEYRVVNPLSLPR